MADRMTSAKNVAPGTSIVSIDGVPGFLTEPARPADPSASHEIILDVPSPGDTFASTWLRAEIRGPGEEPLVVQVRALLASVRYEPAAGITEDSPLKMASTGP